MKIISEPERTEIVGRIESRLVAGYPRQRLAVECGIPSNHLDRLIGLDFRENPYARLGSRSDEDLYEDGDYYRSVNGYLSALAAWLEADEKAQAAVSFAVTPTYQALRGIFETTRASNDLTAIVGGVGIGKSLTAKSYVAEHPRTQQAPGFVYVQFTNGCASPGAALHAILYALIGEHPARRADGLIHDIGRLMRPGDGLILDECNYLVKGLDAIRDLWDAYQVPIITMGNPDFNKMVSGAKPTFTAFASRVLTYEFASTRPEDVDAWLEWAGLSGTEMRQVAINVACRPGEKGGLRSLASLVARFRSMRPGEPVTAANLRRVAETFGRGIAKGRQP